MVRGLMCLNAQGEAQRKGTEILKRVIAECVRKERTNKGGTKSEAKLPRRVLTYRKSKTCEVSELAVVLSIGFFVFCFPGGIDTIFTCFCTVSNFFAAAPQGFHGSALKGPASLIYVVGILGTLGLLLAATCARKASLASLFPLLLVSLRIPDFRALKPPLGLIVYCG